MKKIILVTGSNRGIGFEIVRQLAQLKHTLFLTARDVIKGNAAAETLRKENLNAVIRHLAFYLKDSEIAVNSVCPGWVKTDMGTAAAPRSVEQGADTALWLATEEKIPTGKFWRDRKVIPW